MLYKRFALICGLTLADYLLWNWSVSGNHDVLAIVSGVTLPFLLLASAVLLVLSLARVMSGYVGRSPEQAATPGHAARPRPDAAERTQRRPRRSIRLARRPRRGGRSAPSPAADPTPGAVPSASSSPASPARRRAA